MPIWQTRLGRKFLTSPEVARIGLESVATVAKVEGVPKIATWFAYIRPIGAIIFAEWRAEEVVND